MDRVPETTIDEIIDRYAVLLLDGYGVLVHSSGALPGAADLIARLKRVGKRYYILTNDASKLPATAARRYQSYGLAIAADRFITSGSLLAGYFADHGLAGARSVVLGPEDSRRQVELAGGQVVPPADPFDVLVIGDESGFPFVETVDQVLTALIRKIDRGESVRLVLPNPDLIYPAAGGGFGIASGSVALMLEAALGVRYPGRPDLRFARLGKPHAPIFAEAVRLSGTREMVMIGDQLETDIRGANAFGLDSVLVDGGVTASSLDPLPAPLRPTYRLRSLAPGRPPGPQDATIARPQPEVKR